MTETEFLNLAEATLGAIENALERESEVLDVECSRNGNVLEIEFIDNGSKIIINIQAAMHQLWVAARSGGFHFSHDGQAWQDTRDSSELFAALSKLVSAQGGVSLQLQA